MPAILHLNLYRNFFAQIAAGTKRTEYRRWTDYWRHRLERRHYDVIPLNPIQFDLMSFRESAAVLAAYGFSAKKDLLVQLLALNQEIYAKIEKGEPVTAPGVPKNYPDAQNL